MKVKTKVVTADALRVTKTNLQKVKNFLGDSFIASAVVYNDCIQIFYYKEVGKETGWVHNMDWLVKYDNGMVLGLFHSTFKREFEEIKK